MADADIPPPPRSWLVLALAVVALVSMVDVALGRDESVAGTISVAPLFAAAVCTRKQTALVGAAAAVATAALIIYNNDTPLAVGVRVCGAALAWACGVWVAGRREQRERRIARLTRVAEVAQKAILAPVPAVTGPVALASAYHSASDEASVGGDLLDVVETDAGTHFIVGDVRGKGLTAVQLAAATLRAFRDAVLTTSDPAAAAVAMDRRLRRDLGEEDFVTAILATVTPGGVLQLASCAHPPALLLRDGETRLLQPEPTTPLGLDPQPEILRVALRRGDRVLLYTDGLIEARTASGDFVSLEDVTRDVAEAPMSTVLGSVLSRLRGAVGGHLSDDLALLLVEYRGDDVPRRVSRTTVRLDPADHVA